MKLSTLTFLVCIIYIWSASFFPSDAHAGFITIQITGEIDDVYDPHGYLEGKIEPGDIIKGFYTYETSIPDSSPMDPVQGNYWHYAPPAGIALTVGGFNFLTDPFNIAFRIVIRNNTPSGNDIYGVESSNILPLSNGTQVDYISWSLKDHTVSALLSDALPTTVPVLDDWQENHLQIDNGRYYSIGATVTSSEIIPEPMAILLLSLGTIFLRKQRSTKI